MPDSFLEQFLRKPIVKTDRTRSYQEGLDKVIDRIAAKWDPARGLLAARGEPALPHESNAGFWSLSDDKRAALSSPTASAAYKANAGSYSTAYLFVAAFCWHSPLSRHHQKPELLAFFQNGLHFHAQAIRDEGVMGTVGYNGLGWAHGWDIEGLIYGIMLCRTSLDPKLLAFASDRFQLTANTHASLVHSPNSHAIGGIGNQRAVFTLGLHLYGQFLGRPELIALSDRYWNEAMPLVLDDTGQVIEQHGPCMHYSYTAFVYAWMNLVVRDDRTQLDRVAKCLAWFRRRHTQSLYPFAGPSTRMYYETVPHAITDLRGAAEHVAHLDGSLRDFVDRSLARLARTPLAPGGCSTDDVGSHIGSPTIWAMLLAQDESAVRRPVNASGAFVTQYESSRQMPKSTLKYLLINRDYQTHFNFTDYLPFSGMQTWALRDEPPIIHPTPLAPSTTRADGLDTARQGVSHNWGLFGAGAVGINGRCRLPKSADEIPFVHARYDWLTRLVFYTDRSTVVLEFGGGGPRRTLWTLNRIAPAEPAVEPGVVRFAGRAACLHSQTPSPPRLVCLPDNDDWSRGVRQLEFACGEGPAAFAFSDDSFQFLTPFDGTRFRFADATGNYEALLDARILQPNPGLIRIDPWLIAEGTVVRRIAISSSIPPHRHTQRESI